MNNLVSEVRQKPAKKNLVSFSSISTREVGWQVPLFFAKSAFLNIENILIRAGETSKETQTSPKQGHTMEIRLRSFPEDAPNLIEFFLPYVSKTVLKISLAYIKYLPRRPNIKMYESFL